MADVNVKKQSPRKSRRWLRVISILFILLLLLVVGLYFAGTSSAFLKGIILPRVSKSINAEITVSEASISPFSEIVLQNLRVKTTGEEPLVEIPTVRARYRLMDIIRGNINVDEVTLASPKIVLIQNPDGTSNLDPLLKSKKETSTAEKPSAPSKSSKPPVVDLKKLALTDGVIRQVKLHGGGKSDVTELSGVNLTLTDLKNGGSGKFAVSSIVKLNQNPPAPGTNGALEAKLNGNFTIALSSALKLASIQGNTRFDVTSAAGAFTEMTSLGATLDCDVTPTEIKQVALQFAKGSARLGEVRVFGPFDLEKTEGKITVQILSLDKQVLNLAGAGSGLDFGATRINSTNEIQLTKAGSAITASGQLNINQLQVTRQKETTPVLDLLARYNIGIDRSASNASLNEFTVTGTQKGNALLNAALTSPMNLNWGNPANAVGDSTLNLIVTNLDLADWKPFVGDVAPSGLVNVTAKLISQQGGKVLNFDLITQIAALTVVSGETRMTNAGVSFHVAGKGQDLKQFTIKDYRLEIAQQNQPMVTVSGAGTYDVPAKNADFQVNVQAAIARLAQAMPRPNQTVSSGTADLKAHLIQKGDTQAITGNLALNNLSARIGSNEIHNFGATLDLDVGLTPSQTQLRRITGRLSQDGKPGGEFDLTGTLGQNKTADIKLTKASFNQDGLRPFLQSALGDKQLVSLAVNASVSIQLDPQKPSVIKADCQVANLVVRDPKSQTADTPLEAKLAVDAAVKNQVADINKFLITLSPTERAKNELQITGRVDMSNTNYTQGNIKISVDAMDVTRYYDLFAADKKEETKPDQKVEKTRKSGPGTAAETTSAEPAKEPEPVKLPLNNFTLAASIGHFYLREVDIADLQTQVKIDVSHVVLSPFRLNINGGPVNATADLDLSVPGYKYDFASAAQTIPLAPLVNTFEPDRKGQIGGTLTATAKIKGAGTTGASLKKDLNGNFDVVTTNLGLSVVNVRSKLLKTLVNVITAIPELISNPTAVVGVLVGKGGLTDDLSKAPIETITARGTIGAGKVNLERSLVESSAFKAEAHGDVALADVLTNSMLHVPVSVSLSLPLAEKFGLVPADTPTNAAYARLPDFLTMRGTVGDPKTDIKKTALAATTFKVLGSIAGGISKDTGGILKGVGDILSGTRSSTNSPSTGTNQPATNQTQKLIKDALDIFKKPKKKE